MHGPFILKHLSLLETQKKIMIYCLRCWRYSLMPAGVLTIKRMPSVLSKSLFSTLRSSHSPKHNLLSNTGEKVKAINLQPTLPNGKCMIYIYFLNDFFSLLTVESEWGFCLGGFFFSSFLHVA